MLKYIAKRILVFIPTILVVALCTFWLAKISPGDSVERLLGEAYSEAEYLNAAHLLGLDKPAFYFSFTSAAYPDTMYRILQKDRKETLNKLIAQYGNWPQISGYYEALKQLDKAIGHLPSNVDRNVLIPIRKKVKQLFYSYRKNQMESQLLTIDKAISADSLIAAYLIPKWNTCTEAYQLMATLTKRNKLYTPAIYWYGTDNQFQQWLLAFFSGDFGISLVDSRPSVHKITDALKWTLILSLLSTFLVYLISIPVGVYTAMKRGSVFDKVSTFLLFTLYSLPAFWIATLLVVFFTTPEYGMHWFPSIGLGSLDPDAPFWNRFWETGTHLVLPILCLTYSRFAFVSRQMRGGMLDVIQQDYIRTARAKGLPEQRVTWKHAFRNALFPIVTLFATIFPRAITGSVVIEIIFNIPGMGRLLINSIFSQDWPVVFSIVMLAALLTMLGILVADLLYARIDPRISYEKK